MGGTRYFVVYGNYAPSPFVLYGRFINTNGSPASDTIRLAAANGPIYHTDVAYSGTNFMVIWVEMPSPCILKGVIVSNNGIPIVNAFTIATGVNYDKSAHVIFNGVNYFVTYSRQNGTIYELWGQHYNTTGSPVGNVVRITSTPYSAIYGDIAVGTNSRYLNVWGEYRMNNYDIYANIDIEMVAIREEIDRGKTTNPLKATFVKDLIELVNTDEEAEVLDVTGRYLGRTNKGLYDCSRLNTGTYFILMKPRRNFKVIKIK